MSKELYNIGLNVPFDRIRRITGYLTGSLSNWNDSKQAEEMDRVKHTIQVERIDVTAEQ